MNRVAFALFIGIGIVGAAQAACPNQCSGHGVCGAFDKCTCYNGYTNGDCSGRICPYGYSWADTIDSSTYSERIGHWYAECSDKGTCNRETGACECVEGYEGRSCHRQLCPENCSGHGVCLTMADMNSAYTGWDKDMTRTCVCDPGWEGASCKQRKCKLGNDPMTPTDSTGTTLELAHTQSFVLAPGGAADSDNAFVIGYTDWRGEEFKTWVIDWPPTEWAVKEALQGLPNHVIPTVSVTVTGPSTNDYTVAVTFSDLETPGTQPTLNFYFSGCASHGCQPVHYGVKTGSGVTTGTATLTASGGTSERIACSGRGLCNAESGLCECFSGYFGESCNQQTVIL